MKRIKSRRVFMIILIILLSNISIISFNNYFGQNNNLSSIVHELTPSAADSYWEPYITMLAGGKPNDIFIGDADNDGDNDMVTANWDDSTISIILWNETSGDWDPAINKVTGVHMFSIIIDDANNDGDNDIVAAGYGDENLYIFLWNSTSEDWDTPITLAALDDPYAVAMGDADNDGDIDIVSAGDDTFSMSIFLWNATADDWQTTINITVGASSRGILVGDANNDGYNDIVVDSNGITIFLWNSTAKDWDAPNTLSSPGAWRVAIGDADNDGDNDIAASIRGAGELDIILWNETAGIWDPAITRSTGGLPRCVFIGDANNNGYNDIVTANGVGNSISFFLWNIASEDWDSPIIKATPAAPQGVYVNDANNDGYNDIATANYGDAGNNVSIFLGIPINSTILDPLVPSIDEDGIINLNWSNVFVASVYYIYRETSQITTIDSLTPIAAVLESNYTDIISFNGLYYYGIVAGNAGGNSSISNIENVTVAIPIIAPILNPIDPPFDEDGVIFLNWNDVLSATAYYVYRDSQKIDSVDNLIPIAKVTDSNFTDFITSNGYYFYAIVAENNLGNSSVSNWDVVVVEVEVLPNLLYIDRIEDRYTNETFYFTIEVTDNLRNPISSAQITGMWDGIPIGAVTDNGDGTYNFSVNAILISPGDPGILLSLNASKLGYDDGYLDTEIAVDPAAVEKEPPADGGATKIPGPSTYLITMISLLAIIFVVINLVKRRKFISK